MWWDIFIGFSKLCFTKVDIFLHNSIFSNPSAAIDHFFMLASCLLTFIKAILNAVPNIQLLSQNISAPWAEVLWRVTNFLNFVDWIWALNRPFYKLWLKSERNILIIHPFSFFVWFCSLYCKLAGVFCLIKFSFSWSWPFCLAEWVIKDMSTSHFF